MLRRPVAWMFVLGALLLLSAVAMVARFDRADRPGSSQRMLRLEQALAHLEGGCLTCHEAHAAPASSAPSLADRTLHAALASSLYRAAPLPPVSGLDEGDAHLLDLGRRLAALPGGPTPARDALTDAFLHTYDVTRQPEETSPVPLETMLARVQLLDGWLRDLEHRANPVQVRHAPAQSRPSDHAWWSGGPLAPTPAALTVALPTSAARPTAWALLDATSLVSVALAVVFAAHRRGPPEAGLAWFNAVWSGRLPLTFGQSPFILKALCPCP